MSVLSAFSCFKMHHHFTCHFKWVATLAPESLDLPELVKAGMRPLCLKIQPARIGQGREQRSLIFNDLEILYFISHAKYNFLNFVYLNNTSLRFYAALAP